MRYLNFAAIDDVSDSGDGQRRFRDVGGDDAEAVTFGRRREDAALPIRRQQRIERQHVERRRGR